MGTEFSVLIRIIIAHLIADFFLQPYSWVKARRQFTIRSRHLYYHVAVVGILTYLFMLDWAAWELPLFIAITHFIIDWWKSNQKDTLVTFIADQTAHSITILMGWLIFSLGLVPGQLADLLKIVSSPGPEFWLIAAGYLIVLRPMGFIIEKATRRWRNELKTDNSEGTGLTDAGTWIGYIERVIILTFILIGEYSAIGFLIAAKSVFRFSGGVKDQKERKHAEYILIGTLISFSLAILLGIAIISLSIG